MGPAQLSHGGDRQRDYRAYRSSEGRRWLCRLLPLPERPFRPVPPTLSRHVQVRGQARHRVRGWRPRPGARIASLPGARSHPSRPKEEAEIVSTIVYSARRILTMNPNRPFATHVAVRDGRILGAGTLDELKGWGELELDERFADKVILPGFVEGHSHAFEGGVWKFPYVGYFDRISPEGQRSPGLKSIEEVVTALSAFEKTMPKDGSTLLAWGFDPIYFGGRRMDLADLDKVSTARPVVIIHSNFHVMNANTPVFA